MKKILIITVVLALGLFFKLNAQGQRGNPPSKEERLNRTMIELTKKVELTDEEKISIKEIFSDFFSEMEDMRRDGTLPDRSKMQTLVENRDKKVKAVLSEDKYKAYVKFMETHRRGPGPQGNRPSGN